MLTNVEIRAKARQTLSGSIFSRDWLFAALMVLIISILNGIAGATAIGIFFIAGPIGMACAGYFLHLTRGQIKSENLSEGLEIVKRDVGGSIIAGLLYNLAVSIGYMFFFIPGIIVQLLFGLIYLVKIDNPDLGVIEAFKESYRLIKGHIAQFIMLRLSFIGWILLGMLSFGIGSYFVAAYMNAADAIFYDELLREDRKNRILD